MKILYKIIVSIILMYLSISFGKLFSQNIDTLTLDMFGKNYFFSPCQTINECIDSISQSSDTLMLSLFDNRKKIPIRVARYNINDTAKNYMVEYEAFPISRYKIKEYNIKLLIPAHFNNYKIIVINYIDFYYYFKQDKKDKKKYKYIKTIDLSNNQ